MKFTSSKDFKKTVPEVTQQLVLSADIELTWHLDELMKKRGIGVTELADLTGIQGHTISRYANNRQSFNTINVVHIMALMIALRVSDANEIFTIQASETTKNTFDKESKEWLDSKVMPYDVYKILQTNKSR